MLNLLFFNLCFTSDLIQLMQDNTSYVFLELRYIYAINTNIILEEFCIF